MLASAPGAADASSACAVGEPQRARRRSGGLRVWAIPRRGPRRIGGRGRKGVCEPLARATSDERDAREMVARPCDLVRFTRYESGNCDVTLYWSAQMAPPIESVRRICPIGPGGVAQGESECFACIRSRVQIPAPPTRFFLFCVGSCVCVVLGCVFVGVVCFVFRFVISDRVVKGKRKRQ